MRNPHCPRNKMRPIEVGDVVIRYLPPFSVWHYGIVVNVISQNAKDILILEFADSSGIAKVSLLDFMYGREYFWIDNFDDEISDASLLYPIKERIARAYKMFNEQKLSYTINKYNCEYFVRRCMFRDSQKWISRQTAEIGKDKLTVLAKLALTVVYGTIDKYMDLSDCERCMNQDKFGYKVCLDCGRIKPHNEPLKN